MQQSQVLQAEKKRQLTGRTQTGRTDSLAARAGLKDELIVLVEDSPVPAPSAMAAPPV